MMDMRIEFHVTVIFPKGSDGNIWVGATRRVALFQVIVILRRPSLPSLSVQDAPVIQPLRRPVHGAAEAEIRIVEIFELVPPTVGGAGDAFVVMP
jgi:hypothetical protein